MTPSREDGALTAFVAVIALALFVLAGLVVDGGRAVTARTAAEGDAEQAARAGAAQLSVEAVRQGVFTLAPEVATEAAARYLAQVGRTGVVTMSGSTVDVRIDVVEPTVVLGIVGVHDLRFTVRASATDVHGVGRSD